MKKIFAFISLVIISFMVITGNDLYDQVLGGVIAVIGYVVSFRFTRKIAPAVKYNSIAMSFVHWFIRTIIVCVIIYLVRHFYWVLVDYTDSELASFCVSVVVTLVIAELLKSKTKLKKSYY